jgi:hypothetical protein
MSEEGLKVGVVVLYLLNGGEMSVRAADIRGVSRPAQRRNSSNEPHTRNMMEAAMRSQMLALEVRQAEQRVLPDPYRHAMRQREDNTLQNVLGAGQAAQSNQLADATLSAMSALTTSGTGIKYAAGPAPQNRSTGGVEVWLTYSPNSISVRNTYEEVSGWMRNS